MFGSLMPNKKHQRKPLVYWPGAADCAFKVKAVVLYEKELIINQDGNELLIL